MQVALTKKKKKKLAPKISKISQLLQNQNFLSNGLLGRTPSAPGYNITTSRLTQDNSDLKMP